MSEAPGPAVLVFYGDTLWAYIHVFGCVVQPAEQQAGHIGRHPQRPVEAARFPRLPAEYPKPLSIPGHEAPVMRVVFDAFSILGRNVRRSRTLRERKISFNFDEPDEIEVVVAGPSSAVVVPQARQKP